MLLFSHRCGVVCWGLLFTSAANAQLLSSPVARPAATLEAGLSLSDIDYELEDHNREVERKILGVSYGAPVSSAQLNFFGQFGFSFESEYEKIDEDGSGFLFGFGMRSPIFSNHPMRLDIYGLLNYLRETYDNIGDSNVDLEITLLEVEGGGAASFQMTGAAFRPYVALDLVPYSDGDAKAKGGGETIESDIERDDLLGLRLGALIPFAGSNLRPEIALLGEQSIAFFWMGRM